MKRGVCLTEPLTPRSNSPEYDIKDGQARLPEFDLHAGRARSRGVDQPERSWAHKPPSATGGQAPLIGGLLNRKNLNRYKKKYTQINQLFDFKYVVEENMFPFLKRKSFKTNYYY